MDGKKDPGKFTLRFNVADPQQQAAVKILNQQGRSKAQFIANAVLHYVRNALDVQTDTNLNSTSIRMMMDALSKFQDATPSEECKAEPEPARDAAPIGEDDFQDVDRDAIRRTMEAFQTI